jgi:hypothetical protein
MRKMKVKTVVSLSDQLAVEPSFTDTRFVSGYQQDSLAFRIESKCHPPLTSRSAKTQFLHIRVARVVQGIYAGPSQLRPKLLEEAGQRQNLRSDVFVERVELPLKLIANLDNPAHLQIMTYRPYDMQYILIWLCCFSSGLCLNGVFVRGIRPALRLIAFPTSLRRCGLGPDPG